MDKRPVPYVKTLFVCTNQRAAGEKTACANPGKDGLKLAEALKSAVKQAGLKGRVRVAKSGCLDLCEKGPNAFLYPDGDWFCGLSASDAPALIEKLVKDL
jgi:(2Fe-2S) ferredoxin